MNDDLPGGFGGSDDEVTPVLDELLRRRLAELGAAYSNCGQHLVSIGRVSASIDVLKLIDLVWQLNALNEGVTQLLERSLVRMVG